MQITPYLAFDGNGREALDWYCETLGAELVTAMTFGEMPDQPDWITDANRDRLAHGTIRLGDQTIMASDTPGFEPHKGFAGITLQTSFDSVEEGQAFFDKLAAEGNVMMPFQQTFWARRFGMLTDRFGVPWMVNVEAG